MSLFRVRSRMENENVSLPSVDEPHARADVLRSLRDLHNYSLLFFLSNSLFFLTFALS